MNKHQSFDSSEETYFSWFLDELLKEGLIRDWGKPDTITLAENVKLEFKLPKSVGSRVLLRDQTYTPDFELVWNPDHPEVGRFRTKWLKDIPSDMVSSKAPFISDRDEHSLIEIKGSYVEHDESRIYSILAKWVFQATGKYVQRIEVSASQSSSIFAKTFCPRDFLVTDVRKQPRKIKYQARTLDQLLTVYRTASGKG